MSFPQYEITNFEYCINNTFDVTTNLGFYGKLSLIDTLNLLRSMSLSGGVSLKYHSGKFASIFVTFINMKYNSSYDKSHPSREFENGNKRMDFGSLKLRIEDLSDNSPEEDIFFNMNEVLKLIIDERKAAEFMREHFDM